MKLRPVVASYIYGTGGRVMQVLNEDVLSTIADIARYPYKVRDLAPDVRAELIEMHVLKEKDGITGLDTSVFLQKDIEAIKNAVTPLAEELSRLILSRGSAFRTAPAEVTLFLGGVVAFQQGLSSTMGQKGAGVDWKSYSGKYAKTKVDFDEECEALDAIGPDFLNKYVIAGERYTGVFIGPEPGTSFHTFLPMSGSDSKKEFIRRINYFLVDAYAMLVKGEIKSEPLRLTTEAANLYRDGKPRTAIITDETVKTYQDSIEAIQDVTCSFYVENLDALERLLRSTTASRQGVPTENMLLDLWRYVRKLTAKELYHCGFLTDSVPTEGTVTVFYENNVKMLRRLLI